MCLPKPPKLPDPIQPDPKPEKTAKAPSIGRERKSREKNKRPSRRFRTGVPSLRIPRRSSGNLNY